jgi:hypothetical protein
MASGLPGSLQQQTTGSKEAALSEITVRVLFFETDIAFLDFNNEWLITIFKQHNKLIFFFVVLQK